jgi:hypothetical protein
MGHPLPEVLKIAPKVHCGLIQGILVRGLD